MSKVKYANEGTIMEFDCLDVTSQLSKRIDEYHVDADAILLERINEQSENGTNDIEIGGDSRLCYLICDLIDNHKGEVFCKSCDRTYKPDKIVKESTSPFDSGVPKNTLKGLKKFFKKEFGIKGRFHMSGSGGNTYLCPNRHTLLYVRTWIS